MAVKNKGLGVRIGLMLVVTMVLVLIFSAIVFVFQLKKSLEEESKLAIDSVIESAVTLVESFKREVENGTMSEEEAKRAALNAISNFKYQNGMNYIWVNDYNVKFLFNPTSAEGSNGSEIKDPTGKTFYKDLTEGALKNGTAYDKYNWIKPGGEKGKYYPKYSVAKRIDGWNWVIATGIYIDHVNKIVADTIIVVLIINVLLEFAIIALTKVFFTNGLIKSLNYVSNDITENLEETANVVSNLDDLSTKLAESSNQQAASIQEIAATVEESASMIQKNDENSKYAASLTKGVHQNTQKGYEEMQDLTKAMDKINTSSQEISKIIKVIDDIAFQTNILALNAAVEAARAGDAGKGFAVVAEEVRNLAQKSTESAKDTTVLVENNITLCRESNEMVKAVSDSIAKINKDTSSVNSIIQEVSVATHEQQIGIQQIHTAIAQVEQALQGNSRIAEDTAGLSHKLTDASDEFDTIVKGLKSIING